MTTTSKKPEVDSQENQALIISQEKLALESLWTSMGASEHFVQFCETDAFLVNAVSAFIGNGLRAGDACIVVATGPHRASLEEHLILDGLDIAAANVAGQYVSVDAATTLSRFMVNGEPVPERFAEVIETLIAPAAKGWQHVRVFGEMVALLWADGNGAAAIRLEELWNELGKSHSFSLFCAYSMQTFGGEMYEVQFNEICKQHSHVIPAESYTVLDKANERLRIITQLQQKASSLEVEIAQRKQAEEALLHLAAIVESSDDAILSKNLDGIITSWNAGAERMYGYSAQEIVGRPVTLLFAPDRQDEFTQIMACIREGGRVDHYETMRMRKDGTLLTVSVSVSPIKDRTGTIIGASAIARDISERRELDQRKDEFISMASHELKTPITSLKGFLGLLQRRVSTHGDEKALHYLARMDAQVNNLTKLINDLLDISKMRTGQLAYREDRFDLDALLQEIVENVQGTTQTHQLVIEGIVDADQSAVGAINRPLRSERSGAEVGAINRPLCSDRSGAEVFGDRDRVGQVLINLLNNAIKYSPQADTVLVRVAKDGNRAIVSVRDFGIGIAEEHQQKIFERFYQVSDAEEKTYSGLGIGLYISCEIVRRHGGQMWVESKKGEGAAFHFTLPLLQDCQG